MIQPAEIAPVDVAHGFISDKTLAARHNELVQSHNDLVRLVLELVKSNNQAMLSKYILVLKNCGCDGGALWCDEHRKEEEENNNEHT